MEYLNSRNHDDFLNVSRQLGPELGRRFSVSIENWCGIGERPYPLPLWKLFLCKEAGEIVGLCSYYQQEDDPPDRFWVGWIGVLPAFRRQGMGRTMLEWVEQQMRARGGVHSWVYTERKNVGAMEFYADAGYQSEGLFGSTGLPQAAADDDSPLFKKNLG